MAYNKSPLGGSPLGLIGVRSHYGASGLSTFNAGKTRNVRVDAYNKGSSGAGMLYGNSLFSGYRVVRAWPNVSAEDPKGINQVNYIDKSDKYTRKELHNNSIYDVSVLNIIEQLSTTKAALRPADFAYLKNVGVYPNNRLMIARRFGTPADDNIMVTKTNKELGPFATLISWVPEGEDFLNITFGEEWTDSEADFKNILTSLGDDIGLGNLGGMAGAAGNALPLPGFTEIFQRNFLAQLGLIDSDKRNVIPAGNPNLIKESKRRKLIGYGEAGSGLKCTVNIKMVCEYELKYISGIDPTIVWMDLLGMITRFGTSNSSTYGLAKGAAAKMITWANNPSILIQDVAKAISDAIKGIVDKVREAIYKLWVKEQNLAVTLSATASTPTTPPNPPESVSPQKSALDAADAKRTSLDAMATAVEESLKGFLGEAGAKLLEGLLQKYRVKIVGVINSLSGLPSTPWHITIGNPMRPTFCSGDMLCENVSLSLGPNLTFNDLPSSIKVEFNLTNARNWGLQEIMAKFNSGYLRTVDVQKTFYETNIIPSADGKTANVEAVGVLPLNSKVYETKADENKGSTVSNTPLVSNTPPGARGNPVAVPQQLPFLFTNPSLPSEANQNLDALGAQTVQSPPLDSTKAQDGKLPSEGALSKIADDTPVITKETNNVPFAAPPAPAPFPGPVQPLPLTPPSPIGPPEPPVTPPEPPVTPETPPPPTPPQ